MFSAVSHLTVTSLKNNIDVLNGELSRDLKNGIEILEGKALFVLYIKFVKLLFGSKVLIPGGGTHILRHTGMCRNFGSVF